MTNKKVVALSLGGKTVRITMQRHHWSKRLSLSVGADGRIRLSVPPRTPWYVAEQFLVRSTDWLAVQLERTTTVTRTGPTAAERLQARQLVIDKLADWQDHFNRQPSAIRIANQSSRWGSASSRGTLSFNWRIIELPEDLADYLVVHELAHLTEANHSVAFWQLVERVLPDYRVRRRRLKTFALHD